MSDLPQVSRVGEVWSYNNAAFKLLGNVIEHATSQRFEQAMKELVFDPLGLDCCFLGEYNNLSEYSIGHFDDGSVMDSRDFGHSANPALGIWQVKVWLGCFQTQMA